MKTGHPKGKSRFHKNTIGRRIFRIILGTAAGLMLFFTAIDVIYLIRAAGQNQERIRQMSLYVSEEIVMPLMDEKDQSTLNLVIGNEGSINRFFDNCYNITEMLSSVAERLYSDGQTGGGAVVDYPTKDMIGVEAVYRVDAPGFDPEDPENQEMREIMSRRRHMLRAAYSMSGDISSVYYGSANGFTLFADDQAGVVMDEKGNPIPFDPTSRDWYKEAAKAGKAVNSSLKTDYFTGEPMVTISAPVYADEGKTRLIGVTAVDVKMDTVESILDASGSEIATACLVGSDGTIQISTSQEGLFGLAPDEESNLYRDDVPTLKRVLDKAKEGNSGIELMYMLSDNTEIPLEELIETLNAMDTEGDLAEIPDRLVDMEVYKVYYAPVPVLGGAYLYVADTIPLMQKVRDISLSFSKKTEEQQQESRTSMLVTLLVLLITLGGILVLMYVLSGRLSANVTRPIAALTEEVRGIRGDNLEFTWDMKADEETQTLAESFGTMTEKIRAYIRDLTTVTAEKERIGAELDVARKIQSDMLPVDFPEREDFRLYASMTPAKEVGGDFYDFFRVDDDHLALVMADVSGKGVPAALFMVIAKTLIKHRTMSGFASPKEIFAAANSVLCERNEEMLFVTAWIGILSLSTGEMVCANAGHEYPMIRKAGGSFELFQDDHDIALAAWENTEFHEYTMKLEPGDMLFLYTDGFPESMNEANEQFTEGRMLSALNEEPFDDPKAMDEHLRLRVKEFVGEASQFDDMTALGFLYLGQPEKG